MMLIIATSVIVAIAARYSLSSCFIGCTLGILLQFLRVLVVFARSFSSYSDLKVK